MEMFRRSCQKRSCRRMAAEQLEDRRLLASDFTNPVLRRDVSNDETVSALDALRVINELNRQGGEFDVPENPGEITSFFDVSGNGRVSALDALIVINSLADETPPMLEVSLANDTAIDGTDDDGVTSDASLAGTGDDALGVAFFTVTFGDSQSVRVFPEVEGVLSFDPAFADDGTEDGLKRVTVTATDERGLVSDPIEFFVQLDTQVEFASINEFSIEDRAAGLATLLGATEPSSLVKLNDQTVNSSENLDFQIPNVAIIEGDNEFTLEITDRAGNQRTFQQTFAVNERPSVEINLQSDSARGGGDNADRLTRLSTVQGRVRDLSQVTKLSAGINTDDENTFVDLTDILADAPEGDGATFAIDAAAFARVAGAELPDGEHRLRVIAEDAAGNVSSVVSTFFKLDSQGPAITITSPIADQVVGAGDRLAGQIDLSDPSAVVSYRIGANGLPKQIIPASDGEFSSVLDFRGVPNGPNQIIVTAEDDAGNVEEVTIDVNIQVAVPFQLTNTFPSNGQSSVGVTFKPSVQFASPVDPTTVTSDTVFLSRSGVKIDVNVVVSDDGLQATIFPQANLPSSSTVSLTVDGDNILSPEGVALDGDFDDQPGGLFRVDFTTLNMAPVPNTAVVGRVLSPGPDNLPFTADDSEPGEDGIRGTDDDVFLLPLQGIEVNLQGGSQVVTTDEQGFYRLDQVPIGPVIVAVHGATATNIPDDVFYPEFQKRATVFPGQDNTIDGGMFNLFLPRLDKRILRTVSNATGAVITGDDISAPDLPPEVRDQLRVEIAPGSLRDAFGNPVDEAQVGIQTVPPELIIDGMPLGLQLIGLDQVITVQALGVRRFSQPASVTMPNLSGSAPGERLDFLSFDHDQGALLREGAFVVSADGQTITTEEGSGIIHPGWHPPSRPGSLLRSNVRDNNQNGNGNNASADSNAAVIQGGQEDVVRVNPVPVLLTSEADKARVLSKNTPTLTLGVENRNDEVVRVQQELNPDDRFIGDVMRVEFQLLSGQGELREQGVDGESVIPFPTAQESFKQFPISPIAVGPGERRVINLEINEISDRLRRSMDNLLADFALQDFRLVLTVINDRTNERIGAPIGYDFFRFYDLLENSKFKSRDPNSNDGSIRSLTRGLEGTPTHVRLLNFPLDGQPTEPELRVRSQLTGSSVVAPQDGLIFMPGKSFGSFQFATETPIAVERFQIVANIGGMDVDVYEIDQQIEPRTTINPELKGGIFIGVGLQESLRAAINTNRNVIEDADAQLELIADRADDIETKVQETLSKVLPQIFGNSVNLTFAASTIGSPNLLAVQADPRNFRDPSKILNDPAGELSESFGFGTDLRKTFDALIKFGNEVSESNDTNLGRLLSMSHLVNDRTVTERKAFRFSEVILAQHLSQRFLENEEKSIIRGNLSNDQIVENLSNALSNSFISAMFRLIGIPQAAQRSVAFGQGNVVSRGNIDDEIHIGGLLTAVDPESLFTLPEDQLPDSIRFAQYVVRDNMQLIKDDFSIDFEKFRRFVDLTNYFNRALALDPADNRISFKADSDLAAPGRGFAPGIDVNEPIIGPLRNNAVDLDVDDQGETAAAELDVSNNTDQDRTISSIEVGESPDTVFATDDLEVGTIIPAAASATTRFTATRPADDDGGERITEPVTITFDDGSSVEFNLSVEFPQLDPELIAEFVPPVELEDSLVIRLFNPGQETVTIFSADLGLGEAAFEFPPPNANSLPDVIPFIRDSSGIFSVEFGTEFDPGFGVEVPPSTFIDLRGVLRANDRARLDLGLRDETGRESTSSITVPGNTLDPLIFQQDDILGEDFVRIEFDNSIPIRLPSDDIGNFEVNGPPSTPFTVSIYDPVSGGIAIESGISNISGQVTALGPFTFAVPTGFDADGDGLVRVVEEIIGTSDQNPDTNGDGIDDFQAIRLGLNPAAGVSFPTGVIAAIELSGDAREVVSVGSVDDLETQTSFIATGDFGLSIVDTTRFEAPVILSEIDLPGFNADVAVDATRDLAVVAGGAAGLHFVDIANPLVPVLIESVPLTGGANRVETFDGVAYVASGENLVAIDLLTRRLVQDIAIGGVELTDVVREGNRLFTMDTQGRMTVLSVDDLAARVRGSVSVIDGGGKIFIGDGLLIATAAAAGGYATVDVSDPDAPVLISGVDGGIELPEVDTVASGSEVNLTIGQIPTGAFDLVLTDGSVPAVTDTFIASFSLPTRPHDLEIAGGVALIANGTAGLQIVNFQPFDIGDVLPTVELSTNVDIDPNAEGIQILEGTSIPITAVATDDVHVRNVQLRVDGEVFENDVSFPYDFMPPANGDGAIEIVLVSTDTGFNTSVSDPLVIEIVPDTFAPQLVETSPSDGDLEAPGQQLITLTFDESLDVGSITEDDFTILDGNDNPVAIEAIDFRVDNSVVRLLTESIGEGSYDVTVALNGVSDRAGNPGFGNTAFQFDVLDFQADVFWIGQSGDWSDEENWSTGELPGANDAVLISVPGDIAVSVDGQRTIGSLLVTERLELVRNVSSPLSLTVGGDALLLGETFLTGIANVVTGDRVPQLTVQGDLVNNGVFDWAGGEVNGTGGTWTNRGTVVVSGGGLFKRSTGLTLINQGTIDQQAETDVDLADVQNVGTYQIAGGDIKRVGSVGVFSNEGTLRATGAEEVNISTQLVNRGLIVIEGETFIISGLNEPQDGGVFEIAQNATLEFRNGLNVSNTLTFNGAGNVIASSNGQDITLNSGAAIVNNLTGNFILDSSSGSSSITFSGTGEIENNGAMTLNRVDLTGNIVLDNNGTLGATGFNIRDGVFENSGTTTYVSGTSTIDAGGVLDNQAGGNFLFESGTLQGSGEILNAGRFVNTTTGLSRITTTFIDAGGTVDIVEGTLQITTGLNLDAGGTLQGRGTLLGNATNTNGTVAPGASPGSLTIDGSYTQLAGGRLFVEIGGITAGDRFDRLSVTGSANLAGTLKIELIDDFVPDAADRFGVMAFDSRTGDFDSIDSDTIDNVIRNFLNDVLELELQIL